MSGPALSVALKESRPDIQVMFMSAFTGGDLLVLNYGWAFIDKSFVPVKVLAMINRLIRITSRSQGEYQYDSGKKGAGRRDRRGVIVVETLKTILVVDDCDLVLNVLVATLKNAHFVVLEADSGPKALRLAADHPHRIDLLWPLSRCLECLARS